MSSITLIIGFLLGRISIRKFIGLKPLIKRAQSKIVEGILLGITIYLVFCQFLNPNPVEKNSVDILNFFANIVFAWFLTKYSTKKDYEEKQKELSAISYRHSLSIKNKLEFNLKICQLTKEKLKGCKGGKDGCIQNQYMLRVEDQLRDVLIDANSNLNDWASNIAEEINNMKEIKDKKFNIKQLELELQTCKKESKEYNNIEIKIQDIRNEIRILEDIIGSKIRHTLETADDDEKNNTIKAETELHDTKMDNLNIKTNIKAALAPKNI